MHKEIMSKRKSRRIYVCTTTTTMLCSVVVVSLTRKIAGISTGMRKRTLPTIIIINVNRTDNIIIINYFNNNTVII